MVSIASARKAALSLPEVEEKMHFNIPDFRMKNKIFASIHSDKNYLMVKLSMVDQSVFCSYNSEIIFPVPGGWGRQGATFINLQKIREKMMLDALTCAWKNVAPKKIIQQYFDKE